MRARKYGAHATSNSTAPTLSTGIALEDSRKDYRRQGDADIVLFVRPLDDVHQCGVGTICPWSPPPGVRMQAEWHREVLGCGP